MTMFIEFSDDKIKMILAALRPSRAEYSFAILLLFSLLESFFNLHDSKVLTKNR